MLSRSASSQENSERMFLHGVMFLLCVLFIAIPAEPSYSAKRVAFVVGIDEYDKLPAHRQLTRSVNDARAMSAEFGRLGYSVVYGGDLSRSAFNAKWQEFLDSVGLGDTVALFLSGHGIEIDGQNFLLPRDVPYIQYGREEQLKRESLSISQLLQDLRSRSPKITLMILDACRENPLIPDEFRKGGKVEGGLARIEAGEGTFIMYSAEAGKTALDRLSDDDPSKHSVYVRALLPLMLQPSLSIRSVALQVRSKVRKLARTVNHPQLPAYYDGIDGAFCLGGCDKGSAQKPAADPMGDVVPEPAAIDLTEDLDVDPLDYPPPWADDEAVVRKVQQRLDDLGYEVKLVDGEFGTLTNTALNEFLRDVDKEAAKKLQGHDLINLLGDHKKIGAGCVRFRIKVDEPAPGARWDEVNGVFGEPDIRVIDRNGSSDPHRCDDDSRICEWKATAKEGQIRLILLDEDSFNQDDLIGSGVCVTSSRACRIGQARIALLGDCQQE